MGCQARVIVRSVDIELGRLTIYEESVLFIRHDDALASLIGSSRSKCGKYLARKQVPEHRPSLHSVKRRSTCLKLPDSPTMRASVQPSSAVDRPATTPRLPDRVPPHASLQPESKCPHHAPRAHCARPGRAILRGPLRLLARWPPRRQSTVETLPTPSRRNAEPVVCRPKAELLGVPIRLDPPAASRTTPIALMLLFTFCFAVSSSSVCSLA